VNVLARLSVFGILAIVACGGDSTAPVVPTGLSSQDALQSLTKGLTAVSASTASPDAGLTLAMLPPVSAVAGLSLSQASVSVDGAPVHVFALARRVVYPTGTCLEQLLGVSNFTNPDSCTGLPGALSVVLWQTSSASQPPDRVAVLIADVGTVSFANPSSLDDPFTGGGAFPPIGLYLERGGSVWLSSGGSISSTVTATGQTCTMPPPVFAKSATCGLGSFLETGSITFSPLELGSAAPTGTHTLVISSQTLNGIIQTVAETVPLGSQTI
jgi:hypothetical protein